MKRKTANIAAIPSESGIACDPKTTCSPLLLAMLGFLIAFPWLAHFLPAQYREYIGILFR
jgi:hypothetical protein